MSNPVRCTCGRCRVRGLMWPVAITALGVLFLLGELNGGRLSFANTFPVMFIVIGTMLVASALAPVEGHLESQAPQAAATPPAYSASAPGPRQ